MNRAKRVTSIITRISTRRVNAHLKLKLFLRACKLENYSQFSFACSHVFSVQCKLLTSRTMVNGAFLLYCMYLFAVHILKFLKCTHAKIRCNLLTNDQLFIAGFEEDAKFPVVFCTFRIQYLVIALDKFNSGNRQRNKLVEIRKI